LGALIVVSIMGISAGSAYTNSFSLPNTQSADAIHLLHAVSPKDAGDVEQVVFESTNGKTITNPAIAERIENVLTKISKIDHVTNIVSPLSSAGATQISKSRTIAFASVTFDELSQYVPLSVANKLVSTAQSADSVDLHVAVGGQVAELTNKISVGGLPLGVLAAGIVLLLVFGSLLAMALPLISALASLGIATGLIELLSHVLKMPQFSSELTVLIGLGVGVDYALFIVTRHRQGLMTGHGYEESIVNAVNTSGRAVLFAGIIVCIALLGMFALGVSYLYGLALAASLGVLLTMTAALTLLPALLGFIGPRVLSRRQRKRLGLNDSRVFGAGEAGGFWSRWADIVNRRPIVPALVALGMIVVIALPFFSMQLGSSDQGNDPAGTTTRQAYDTLSQGFGPGFNGPLQLVAEINSPSEKTAFIRVVNAVAKQSGVSEVPSPTFIPAKNGDEVALADAFPTSSPQAGATTDLVERLRNTVVPRAEAGTKLTVLVGGSTAVFIDFAHVLSAKLPLFIGLVVLLSFLLLAMVFRSLLIPLISAALNILSIGAAFGIITAVFQWGWLDSFFGIGATGPIESFLPVMLFAIVFGLSMDYQVFLVSRIHEEWIKTGDSRLAARNGLAATGKTISAAALIMILVFGSFVLGGDIVIKEFGLGLAGGILVDAFVIRLVVVPAMLSLLGRPTWWFPSWLDRCLPNFAFEESEAPTSFSETKPSEGDERAEFLEPAR
jgi:RND superfamily putative drug exporter